ncbi:beta-N-acetylhexosaminidase [Xenorhabdus hominickii]|uniref:beta-N-acetylhexosaminidase n=1 Tax=Xenorhabdus hominickii TaxID=351679 RepID=A0A2G0QD00_XENHO|nr:family 20 glycosylhydrolase [Xenorhabdus hominickii]AOM41202.1 beta-N-acetylhexosaminidase [Xenorhabdus hominickii]PHM55550.1 beta-N-acetylhexosaminidase [Xenorhabdus hominickii]PHM57086.1 beta-N-acetylhexosaminidase [Xenorhabdus hominickii]
MKFPFRPLLLITALSCSFSAMAVSANHLPLMPWPQQVSVQQGRLYNIDRKLNIIVTGDEMQDAISRWRKRIEAQTGWILPPPEYSISSVPTIRISIAKKTAPIPQPNNDESYQLVINSHGVTLKSATRFGAMRGVETLLQLLQNDHKGTYLPLVNITDNPRFSWRGVILDSARHFLPVEVIKRQLDGMAAAKMNVFHWHLTDDQGWRFASDHYPKLQQRASDGLFYSKAQMQDVVAYASSLGIRVVPEIDLPGHASAIAVAYPELISTYGNYEMQRQWGVHKPTLDPSNPQVHQFVDTLIGEITEIFPDPYIHIGGDEVDASQWQASKKIQIFMQEKGLKDSHALHAWFNQELETILEKHGRKMVGWDEIYHPALPKSIVIQSWQGQDSLGKTADEGYQGILSTGFYLDQPQSAAYHYRNEVLPQTLNIDDNVKADETAQSWSFTMPRLKGNPVTGSFTLIQDNNGKWRGFIDFAGKSRRAVNSIVWRGETVKFTVDSWMGETTPVVNLNQQQKTASGYILLGNVRYPVTGEKLATTPAGNQPVVPANHHQHNILGAEAALWSENVTAEVLDIKLWPRTFAIAERLWSAKDVTNEKHMYQRLHTMDAWTTVSVGLQQQANSQRLMTRLANNTNIEPLQILAEAVEPAQYYSRHHSKFQAGNYHQYEPLYRFADTLGSESLVVREMETLVDRLLKNKQDWQAEQALRDRLIRWRDNHNSVMKIVKANYMMRDLVPVANDVSEIAELGLVMLDHVKAGKTFSPQQQQDAQKLLTQGTQMRDEVVIRAVYPLERMLNYLSK